MARLRGVSRRTPVLSSSALSTSSSEARLGLKQTETHGDEEGHPVQVYIEVSGRISRPQHLHAPSRKRFPSVPSEFGSPEEKMRTLLTLTLFPACLFAIGYGAIESAESKFTTKLTPVNNPSYVADAKDLTASASDRLFHVSKDYGQPGVLYSATGGPYGSYLGSVYGPGTGYRGTGYLSPGYTGYRGFGVTGPGGILGGGHVGYGYYGNAGYNPGYGGYSGYNGYGTGLGGYGGYGAGYGIGAGVGSGIYDDGYYGRGGYGYNRYGGLDGYGNYGSTYNARSNYDPYVYRNTNYGTYAGYPSGYRGYS